MHVADTAFLGITAGLMGVVGILLIATARRQVDLAAARREKAGRTPPSPALVWVYRGVGLVAVLVAVVTVLRLLGGS